MEQKIWSFLSQILYERNDLVEVIKPFMEDLNKNNIDDEKYFFLLKTFPLQILEVLSQYEIIHAQKIKLINKSSPQSTWFIGYKSKDNIKERIEKIIEGDNVKELNELIQEMDLKAFNTIKKPFKKVQLMGIPLIQYCIMKKAIACFKFLLVNGFDDPNKIMEEQDEKNGRGTWINQHRYEWDCMATAIYLGNKEIIKILEDKEILKGSNSAHIEAAIFSYRNEIVEEILEEINEENNQNENKELLNRALLASSKNNNIKGVELLMEKNLDLNITDILLIFIKKTERHFIMH